MQVSLYSQDADEQRLLQYLRSARGSLGSPLYEPQFALQVARQHSKLNACVQLLCELNLHEVRSRHLHTLLALLLYAASWLHTVLMPLQKAHGIACACRMLWRLR